MPAWISIVASRHRSQEPQKHPPWKEALCRSKKVEGPALPGILRSPKHLAYSVLSSAQGPASSDRQLTKSFTCRCTRALEGLDGPMLVPLRLGIGLEVHSGRGDVVDPPHRQGEEPIAQLQNVTQDLARSMRCFGPLFGLSVQDD